MSDHVYHIAEIIVLGLPLWGGLVKMFFVFREYPPHLHDPKDVGRIKYPKGLEPTLFVKGGKANE